MKSRGLGDVYKRQLLGMPLVVVVGRGFADGKVELRNRLTGETYEVDYTDALPEAKRALRGEARP